jgi:hypothetical protein
VHQGGVSERPEVRAPGLHRQRGVRRCGHRQTPRRPSGPWGALLTDCRRRRRDLRRRGPRGPGRPLVTGVAGRAPTPGRSGTHRRRRWLPPETRAQSRRAFGRHSEDPRRRVTEANLGSSCA